MPETPEKAQVEATAASPKSSPSKKEIDAATMALNNFAQGKRHLVVGDIQSAVNSLQEACKLLADQYGETAPECGDAYFCYGKALLEMARMESGVIGNALDGEEGSTENEDDDSEADAESQGGESQDGEGSQDGETQEGEEGKEEKEEKDGVEGDKTEDDDEEVSNLQLSWEMLELAKVIFQKQEETNPKMKGKVAEVYLKLGEVGLESENYAQGIEDFKQCLEIQKKALSSDDRCLAETHYQLGIAYSFGDEFDLAIESFNSAVNVIETRIANLEKMMKDKVNWTEEQKKHEAATKVDPFYTEEGEIDELNKLLPEMKEKILDMEQMKKDSKERIKAAKEAMLAGVLGGESSSNTFGAPSSASSAFGAPSTSSSSSSKEAKPIMVVRKKRKLEEEGGGDLSKKIKGEKSESQAAVNGSEMANGQTENNTEGKEVSKSTATADEEMKDTTLAGKKVELKSVS